MKSIITSILFVFITFSYAQDSGLYRFKSKDNRDGFMDKTGKIIIEPTFLRVGKFSEGLCKASVDRTNVGFKWMFIDTTGKQVIDIDESIPKTDFSEGYARLSFEGKHWFINRKGENEFGKTWKDGYGKFENGCAFVSDSIGKNYYKVNNKGQKVNDRIFSKQELQLLKKTEKKQNNSKGNYKSGSYYPFKEKDVWGFKNAKDSVVIKPQFFQVDHFEKGICAVKINKPRFSSKNDYFMDAIIDEDGNFLIKTDMHDYKGIQGDLIEYYGAAHGGGGVYYLNLKGEKVIPHK